MKAISRLQLQLSCSKTFKGEGYVQESSAVERDLTSVTQNCQKLHIHQLGIDLAA